VASDLPSLTRKPLKAAYSASYKNDPVAAGLGIKTLPAILLFTPASLEPISLPIPRKREEFTEDFLTEWVQKNLD